MIKINNSDISDVKIAGQSVSKIMVNDTVVWPTNTQYNGFCKLILNDGSVVELEGSGELTHNLVSDYYIYRANLISAVIGTQCTSIGENAFYECTNLKNIEIADTVEYIKSRSFFKTAITDITIPNKVKEIEVGVFYNCSNLTNVIIQDGLEGLDDYAFQDCKNITSITIPKTVTYVGGGCFERCSSLENIVCNATRAPEIRDNTFSEIKSNGILTVPVGSTGYDSWMSTGDNYLGKYNWTKIEQ